MEQFEDSLVSSLRTRLIDENYESLDDLRVNLIVNDSKKGSKVLSHIVDNLERCDEFYFSVAFITDSALIMLLDSFRKLQQKGIYGKILTTNYLYFNEPKAFRRLLEFPNIEVRVVDDENFHAKGYIFREKNQYKMVVGSSNLTDQALTQNREWNVKLVAYKIGGFPQEVLNEFNSAWDTATLLTEEWIVEYEKNYKQSKSLRSREELLQLIGQTDLKPNKMQKEALKNLEAIRKGGGDKALLISATGTGKTYLSAFDVKEFNPRRMLFVVHREQIARNALESFKNIFGDSRTYGIFSGNKHETDADFIFATVQSLRNDDYVSVFWHDDFEYIIIDEAHHVGANSYDAILNYFKPKFLLGMTATPERTNGYNVFKDFDYNIAYEIRLQKALEENMLCPFHYFGISEIVIDGNTLDDQSSFNLLVSKQRIDYIVEKINFYGYSGERVNGLIFCRRNEEAKMLSAKLNERGFRTISLDGSTSQEEREVMINKLCTDNPEDEVLDYIITVDIFNEGVDIPDVNQIVMLRPTESAIIFVQQLGRGLRKTQGKDYVVVLDFIGNYSKNFLIPIALSGDRTLNKDTLRRYLISGDATIPGASTIMFDEVSKRRIFESINSARFSKMKQLKEEYLNLKNKIGRIPSIIDFYEYGAIDPQVILEQPKTSNYAKFLYEMEHDK